MSQDLNVAKAEFIGSLLRSEVNVPDLSQDDATAFAHTILRTTNICTSTNIRFCNNFISRHILKSAFRTRALVKYLSTLAKAFVPRDLDARIDTTKPGDENEGLGKIINGKVQQPPEPGFKRLHVLYIVHDVLCYSHLHDVQIASIEQLKYFAASLSTLVVCGKSRKTSVHVLDLVRHWELLGIFDAETCGQLRQDIATAEKSDWTTVMGQLAAKDEQRLRDEKRQIDDAAKWMVPERHGVPNDPYAPWHDLPAANALYLRRKYGYPLRASALPPGGFQLPHGGEEASASLKEVVTNIYTEALRCYEKYTPADEVQDVDALGNIIWKDPDRPTRNYWGFSLDAIDKRKELAREFETTAMGYDSLPGGGEAFDNAVERAKRLAVERGRRGPQDRDFSQGHGGWRGGREW